MADETTRVDEARAAARGDQGHRKAFVVGTLLGAAGGVVSAYLKAPRSGRATRAGIQQGVEGALFKVLDMRPTWRPGSAAAVAGGPAAVAEAPAVTGTHLTPAEPPRVAAADAADAGVPTDIVIDGPRPADLHA